MDRAPRHSGRRFFQILAMLAERRPLNSLSDVCDQQAQISSRHQRIVAGYNAAYLERWNKARGLQTEFDEMVAAKDAEIAALNQLCDDRFNEIAELRAQPARQVGGDDLAEVPHLILFDDAEVEPILFAGSGSREAALAKFEQISGQWNAHLFIRVAENSRDDRYPCAALAPAAVVMPERRTDANYPTQLWRESAGWNAALDEVARLNRRAITVELLRRACKDYTGRENWDALEPDRLAAAHELRALLGMDNQLK